jgi:AraC-like DNA-binding protein
VLLPVAALRHGLRFSSGTLAGGLLASALGHLSNRFASIEPGDLTSLAPVLASLVAAAADEAMDPAIKWGREQRMSRIVRFIDANLASQALEPDMIAGHFAMSRATLYRMFEPLGGVAGFIRERRLSRAMADLTAAGSPTRSVAAAGRKAGYPDAASFSRAFKAMFGMPPAEAARLRKARAQDEEAAADNKPLSKSKTLADHLRELSTRKR